MSSGSKAVVIIIDSDTDNEEAAPKPSETHLPQASPAPRRQPAQPQATRSRYGPNWGTNLIADDGSPASLAASRYGPSRGASATAEAGNPAGLATVRTSSSATLSRSATPSRPLSARKRGIVGVSGRANRPLLQGLKSPTRKPPSRGSSAARTPLTRKSLTETPPRLHSGNSSKQAQGLAEWGEEPTEEGGSEGSSEMSREPMAYSVSEGIHTPRWAHTTPVKKTLTRGALAAKGSIRNPTPGFRPEGSPKDAKAPESTSGETIEGRGKSEAGPKTPEPELYCGPFYIGPDSPESPEIRIPASYRAGSDISDGLSD